MDLADYADATGPVLAALAGADPGAAAKARPWTDRDVLAADVEGARGGPRGDTLLGNAGDNLLEGGAGEDFIDGGAGADRLQGGPGRDLLVARDATADELRCGTARDLAVADADDQLVALRADACELIDAGAPGALPRVLGTAACPAQLRLPGVGRSFRLPVASAVPWRTRVLRNACGATVQPPRTAQTVRAAAGAFSLERGRRNAALTLALRDPLPRCRPDEDRELRRLEVAASPRVLVDGRSADVRAARAAFTLTDRCEATEVRLRRGRAVVFAGGRRATVRAPNLYRARRGPR